MDDETIGCSIKSDWDGLKRMAKEFFDALPTRNVEELENGFKVFGLAYIGCQFEDSKLGKINQFGGAPALLRIVSRHYFNRLFELQRTEKGGCDV